MKDYPICMTARLSAESQSDNVSITNVVERLDIEMLLQRAQQGILDLRTFQRPMQADFVGAGGTPEQIERTTRAMFNEPDSPTNRVFGVDRETADKAQKELLSLAEQHRVKKVDPSAPAEPSKDDPGEGDNGKDIPPTNS